MSSGSSASARVLIVTPVFNEARHIERVVRAMAGQARPPDRWIVVDDGSTDGTLDCLRRLEAEVPFMEVYARPAGANGDAGPDRLGAALEVLAFHRGLTAAGDLSGYTHIGKIDGDIELPTDYFARLLDHYAQDPSLGLAGGRLIEPDGKGWRRLIIPDYHVHGALKLYTRECYERIGGVQARLAWDTIDETYARMFGFRTRSFSDLVAQHLRPHASADGQLRGRARHGECAWILHYSLPWVLMRAAKVALDPPRGLSAAAFLYGYARAAVRSVPQVDDPRFRTFTRAELRRRLRRTQPILSATTADP